MHFSALVLVSSVVIISYSPSSDLLHSNPDLVQYKKSKLSVKYPHTFPVYHGHTAIPAHEVATGEHQYQLRRLLLR